MPHTTLPLTPCTMGIININDDSFSGDGTLIIKDALESARDMVVAGADYIDIGAESARTNRDAISADSEIDRLTPFIEQFGHSTARLSINTWRPEVIRGVLEIPNHGIHLINDISGLPTAENAEICAGHDVSLLIMHTVGIPKVPHFHQQWDDVLSAVEQFFEDKIALAESAGLPRRNIILDPGIDFAKQKDDNLLIYRHLERIVQRFSEFPILLPISRKTVIGDVLDIENPADRDAGTVACLTRGLQAGAHIFRVHNVAACVNTLRTLRQIIA